MKCHLSKQSRVLPKPPNARCAFSTYLCNAPPQKALLTNISLRQPREGLRCILALLLFFFPSFSVPALCCKHKACAIAACSRTLDVTELVFSSLRKVDILGRRKQGARLFYKFEANSEAQAGRLTTGSVKMVVTRQWLDTNPVWVGFPAGLGQRGNEASSVRRNAAPIDLFSP